jgi:hypothetical protein
MAGFQTYALARGKSPGRRRGYNRQQFFEAHRPTLFFTDRFRFPLEPASTTDLGKAKLWRSKQGAYQFLSRHAHLHKKFYPLTVEAPTAADTFPQRRGRSSAVA